MWNSDFDGFGSTVKWKLDPRRPKAVECDENLQVDLRWSFSAVLKSMPSQAMNGLTAPPKVLQIKPVVCFWNLQADHSSSTGSSTFPF